jgi:hypothetical protein
MATAQLLPMAHCFGVEDCISAAANSLATKVGTTKPTLILGQTSS